MVSSMSDPPHREPFIALILGFDVRRSRLRRGRVLGGTAVDLEIVVAKCLTLVNGQNGIDDTVDSEVCDRRGSAVAAAELGSSDRSNSTEDVYLVSITSYGFRPENLPAREQARA